MPRHADVTMVMCLGVACMRHGVVSSVVCQNRRRPRESLFQSHTIEELTAVVVEGNLSTKFREKL